MVLPPEVKIVEFDVTAAMSGTWKGFVDTTTRALDFGAIDNSISGVVSDVKVVAMSGVEFNGNTVIEDMRFYAVAVSAFSQGTYQFLMDLTNVWTQNRQLTIGADNVPTSLPSSQNYFRHGGGAQITGSGQVDGLGQWAYLAIFAGTDVPDGTYGGLGVGTLKYRVRYDYY
jgi:hypothetical protein